MPITVHNKQLTVDATQKGNGMALADLVWITTFKAASGDANMAMQKTTPADPMTRSGDGMMLDMATNAACREQNHGGHAVLVLNHGTG